MGLLLSAALVIVLATMIFADTLVPLLLGARFAEAAVALKILIWAVILRYLNYALNSGLLAAKRERVFIVTSSVCLAVNLIGNLILIPVFSWRAAAALTIGTELVVLILNQYWLRQVTGTISKAPWLGSDFLGVRRPSNRWANWNKGAFSLHRR